MQGGTFSVRRLCRLPSIAADTLIIADGFWF